MWRGGRGGGGRGGEKGEGGQADHSVLQHSANRRRLEDVLASDIVCSEHGDILDLPTGVIVYFVWSTELLADYPDAGFGGACGEHVFDAGHLLEALVEELDGAELFVDLEVVLHLLEEVAVVGGVVEEGRHAEVVHYCAPGQWELCGGGEGCMRGGGIPVV